MAANKKRAFDISENNGSKKPENNSESSSDESEMDSEEVALTKEEIQVDFEGRYPIDSDFHGIKQLLHQLFLKAHLNLSELTELIIGQSYVGSVLKQSFDGEEELSDDEDDESNPNDVFGITTVINLTEKQNLECVAQLRNLLLELSSQYGNDEKAALVKALLEDDMKPVGLLLNERFINIPSRISIPLLLSLSEDIKKAANKKMPYEFSYFVLICKLYKLEKSLKKKNKKNVPEVVWSNQEEEFIVDEAEISLEFSVKNESDSGLSGRWSDTDAEMTPYRNILIFKAEKLDGIIKKLDGIVNRTE